MSAKLTALTSPLLLFAASNKSAVNGQRSANIWSDKLLLCHFTALLFDAKSSSGDVHIVRYALIEATRSLFLIPPTETALL